MKFPKIVLLFIFFNNAFCFSQKASFVYQPDNLDSIQSYINAVSVKKIKKFEGLHQKEIKKIIEERKASFMEDIKDSAYIFDKRINAYMNSVLKQIFNANPDINNQDFYFFIDKSPIPNAACYGNGIFTVNMGLFNLITSDDELAFILCHEIGHYILEHNDKSLLNHVETMNSKETRKKISKVNRISYGKRQAVSDLIKDLNYNFLRRSRTSETEADSLGYILLSKTHYSKAGGLLALEKLDMVDSMIFNTDSQLKKHFNFELYPFKDVWIAPDETLFDLKEKSDDMAFDKDSLKTHPDIPLRLEKLKKFYTYDTPVPVSERLTLIKKISSENSVSVFLDNSKIDLALYQILTLYDKNEIDTKQYSRNVVSILKKTYELKANHSFGKYVSQVSPFSDEKYLNEVKLFLHHLELKNIKKIGLQFCMKYQTEMVNDPEFQKTTAFFKNLNP